MEYFKASEEHAEQIYNLVQNTITAVYPRYYPEGWWISFAAFTTEPISAGI